MTEHIHFLSFFLYPLSSKRMPETVSSILVLEFRFGGGGWLFVCLSNPILLYVVIVVMPQCMYHLNS